MCMSSLLLMYAYIYIYICVCVPINLFIGVFICLFQGMLLLHVAFVYTHFCWLHMCLSCAFAYAYIDIYMYICTNLNRVNT